jgi:outer membrane lipoprotein-sorting protein
MLLSGQGDLRAEFDMGDGGTADGLAWTRLSPKTAEGDFRELRVGLSGAALRAMTLVDRLGQTTRIEFERVERNPRFDASTFSFTPPPGVDVVGRAPAGAP